MHITAMKPEYISEEEISEDAKKMMQEVFGKEVELNVTLPDGQKLFSKTKIPEGTFFNEEKTLPYIPGPLIGRDTSNMNVVWESSLSLAKAQKVTLPYYYKDLNGVKTKHKVNIPINVTSSTINNNPSDYINTSFKNELLIDRKLFERILQNAVHIKSENELTV